MAHDVYLCYDENDQKIANEICTLLESNRMKCWIKSRDAGVKHMVDEIMESINESKLMVLIFSESSKNSNFVNTEVDFAFSGRIPILIYKIDDSAIEGGLELFLKNRPVIDSHEDPKGKFDKLVEDASKIVKENKPPFYITYKIPIIIAVAVILIAAVGVFVFHPFDGGTDEVSDVQIDPGNISLNITDFKVEDVRKQSSSWNYSYFVEGTVNPVPANSKCKIIADFYDESGTLVESTETLVSDAQKIGSGFVLGSATSDKNNIKLVDVQVVDANNIILAQSESRL